MTQPPFAQPSAPMDDRAAWREAWDGLRARRMTVLVAPASFIPAAFLWTAEFGFLLAAALTFAAAWLLRGWRCPRCQHRFAGSAGRWWPDACVACRLPAFASAVYLREASYTIEPDAARLLTRGFRRVIAGSQIAGGALVMLIVLSGFLGTGTFVGWWYAAAIEALGVFAVLAGVWLWQDDPRGYSLSRLVQGLQVAKFQLLGVTYAVSAGFELKLALGGGTISTGAGLQGALTIWVGSTPADFVVINVLAAIALILLWEAAPAPRRLSEPVPAPALAAPDGSPPATG